MHFLQGSRIPGEQHRLGLSQALKAAEPEDDVIQHVDVPDIAPQGEDPASRVPEGFSDVIHLSAGEVVVNHYLGHALLE